ncbi:MAG: glycerol-3-phosphate dehydrogenase [Burkholderiales bacterium]|nr:glycerol-3-phosphate dehydrogenase [Burkholderiales bacterium]
MDEAIVGDVLVVGGGVNGAGIARDLAGRGLRVVLAERDDLASHTSSASSKLIHGGLRYLEQGDFALVRKSLIERERLLAANPHLMQPLRLILPHDRGQRPLWLLRLGLFLYDHLAPRHVSAGSGAVRLADSEWGAPLQPRFTQALAYSDGWADDARLVLACAQDAAARGAIVLTRHACVHAEVREGRWLAQLQGRDGSTVRVRARALVNAAGPWASAFLRDVLHHPRPPRLRLVQGTHLVIARRWTHAAGYLLQNPDGRVLFALPFQGEFTLLGTTDQEVSEPQAGPSEAEIEYLCTQASRWLREPVTREQVLHSFAGVRPLVADEASEAKRVTRDYQLDLVLADGAPRLDVWGGKLTTFRLLAEQAADRLGPLLGAPRGAWTADAPLPDSHWRPGPDDGPDVAPGVPEGWLRHCRNHEWATNGEDFLWRRSKMGLRLDATQQAAVAAWFERQAAA